MVSATPSVCNQRLKSGAWDAGEAGVREPGRVLCMNVCNQGRTLRSLEDRIHRFDRTVFCEVWGPYWVPSPCHCSRHLLCMCTDASCRARAATDSSHSCALLQRCQGSRGPQHIPHRVYFGHRIDCIRATLCVTVVASVASASGGERTQEGTACCDTAPILCMDATLDVSVS